MRLRPGYGLAVDDWRVAETWKTVQGKLAHAAAYQPHRVADPLAADRRRPFRRAAAGAGRAAAGHGSHAAPPTDERHRQSGRPDLQPARIAGSAAALGGPGAAGGRGQNRAGADAARAAAEKEAGADPAGHRLGIGPARCSRAGVWPAEHGGSARRGSRLDRAAFRHGNSRRDDSICPRQPGPPHRRPLSRSGRAAARARPRLARASQAGEHPFKLVREGGELDLEEQSRVFGEALPKGLRVR